MREFKSKFEELGYTFQSADVLEDVYLFYKYYNNIANEGVAAIILEGDPGSGKTFLSKVFSAFLGEETENIYTQCVDETNSDRLISTYNVPAIVKGDSDESIAEGILTKAINLANAGKKVVLTIDELDKARSSLDSYFLDFLQDGRIETSDNKILALSEAGLKNLYVILAKNDERVLLDALLRRCSVIKLPPMPPVLAYKTLVRRFENAEHDSKFLKFISKVYEAIYNEQMNSNEELLSRLPSLQELITAITSDNELYKNGISSTRRINHLIRKLGKDDQSREVITNILTNKFKYKNQESNYMSETLDLDMDNPDDYMNTKNADSLVEQYIEKKDNGEYIFEEDEFEDPMKDIANILDNMKDDQALVFLDKENREKIVELGVITHHDPRALEILFEKIKYKGNPNSRFGFLDFEDDNFIGLMKYKNTLILIANREYVSPRLLIRALCVIMSIIYDVNENIDYNKNFYFGDFKINDFKFTGLNAKILSNIPDLVLSKMSLQNGVHTYLNSNIKITYDDSLNIRYFRYLQKFKAEPFYETIEKICSFNPELALSASFINAKKFSELTDRNLVKTLSRFEEEKERWEKLKLDGWEVQIDEFQPMDLSFVSSESRSNSWDSKPTINVESDIFVFDCIEERNESEKRLYVFPKYKLKDGYLLYTSDVDFENDDILKKLDPFQREIALFARSIFGNFIPELYDDGKLEFFTPLTMFNMGVIVGGENNVLDVPTLIHNITLSQDFADYYDSISNPSAIITPNKVLTKELK